MAVPLDALQVMMAELQKMNHQNMTELVKQQFEALAWCSRATTAAGEVI